MNRRLLSVILCVIMVMTLLPTLTFADGATAFYIGNAVNFADSDDSLSTSYLTAQLDNITMEAWVKADTLTAGDKYIRIMYNGNSGNSGYGIYIQNNMPLILVGGNGVGTVSGVTLTTSKWYHLAAVRNSGAWTFYVNGKAYTPNFGTGSYAPNAIAAGNTFTVGNRTDLSENFIGSIDEVRFWTVARTAQQIKENMYIKLQGSESGLLAYYNFDQEGITAGGNNSSITTVTDVAGGDNNLSVSGFTLNGSTSNFVQSVDIGTFALDSNAYSAADGGSAKISIVRTGGSEGSVTVNYQTTDGTAMAGTHYTSASGSVTFADGETSKEISVQMLDSFIGEQKTFTLRISAQSGVSISTPDSTTVTIMPSNMDGLFAGEFKAGSQLFDVNNTHSDVSGTEVKVWALALPYYNNTNGHGKFLESDLENRHFVFRDLRTTAADGLPGVGLFLYNDDDDQPAAIAGKVNNDGLVSRGNIVFTADEGLLYTTPISGGSELVHFVSNSAGYNYGDFNAYDPLYLRRGSIQEPSLDELLEYNASSIPMSAGEVLLRFYENGQDVTGMPEPNEISVNTNTTAFTIGSSFDPSRPGYTFVSWNTSPDGSGTTYAPGAEYDLNVGVDLYAQWQSSADGHQSAPENTGTENAADFGGSGSITGTTAAMQYRTADDGNTWYWCSEGSTAVPVGEYWVRYASKEGFSASPEVRAGKVLDPSKTPVAADFAVINVNTNGGSDGRIVQHNTALAYEYSINGGTTYQDITENEITGLYAGAVQIRRKAVAEVSLASAAVTLYVKQPAAGAPGASLFTISHVSAFGRSDGTISGVTDMMEYRLMGDSGWHEVSGSSLTSLSSGRYEIRYRETNTAFVSGGVILMVKQPAQGAQAPAVGAEHATVLDGLGKITDTTTAMEYRLSGEDAWADCTEGSTTVVPGTYSVRYKETAENAPSASAEVAVKPVMPTIAAADAIIFANGNALVITGTDDTHSTVYIDSNSNGIADAGEQSLYAAGVDDAPEDGTDLSQYTVYGGSTMASSCSTQIVMFSGRAEAIYGGNRDYQLTGNTSVNISGGTVTSVYGGGYYGTVSGNAAVTMSGGTVADLRGGGKTANVNGNTTVSISGGTVTNKVSGAMASQTSAKKVYVSGDPKIAAIDLNSFTANKFIIDGVLTGADGDIKLQYTNQTIFDKLVFGTAITASHADSAKFAFYNEHSAFHLAHDSITGKIYAATNTSTLCVDPNGGTWNDSAEVQNFTQNAKTTKVISVPTRTGYTFTGWERTNTNGTMTILATGSTYRFSSSHGVTDTLTAQWEANDYTVVYDGNKPAGATGSVTYVPTGERDCTYDTNFTLGDAPKLTGYTFGGWYKDAACEAADRAGDAKEVVSNLTAEKNAEVTLYAKFTANTDTAYTVKHYVMDTDGNYPTTATQTDDLSGTSDASLTLSVLKDADLEVENGIVYSHGEVGGTAATLSTILPDGSQVIKLYYSRERYALTAASGTGFASLSDGGTYCYGKALTVSATANTGYTWDKWTSSNTALLPGSTDSTYSFNMPAGAVTLTASATLNKYSVSYAASQHGSITGSTAANYISAYRDTLVPDTGYALPASITMTMGGSPFTGFTYDSSTGVIAIAASKILGDIEISGKCTPIDYTVTYETDGAAAIANGSYNIEDTSFTLPQAPEKRGYTFAGWLVTTGAAGGTGFTVSTGFDAADSSAVLSGSYGNVTLTAQWTLDTYTITYDPNGGKGAMTNGTATHGIPFTLPKCTFTAPADKQFKGWAIGSTEGAEVAEGSSYSFTSDTTVYAVWEDMVQYRIIKGQNGTWMKGGKNGLSFTAEADYWKHIGVSVDGIPLAYDKYTVVSGSTIVTLKASYLETLSIGRHLLRLDFIDGYAETYFTITAKANIPQTGDNTQLSLWLGVALLSGAVLAAVIVAYRSKHKR